MVDYKTGTSKSGKTYRIPTTATLGGSWADTRSGGGGSSEGDEGQVRKPEVRHDWKQVGTSSSGTPIWENEVGERRAEGRKPAVNVSGIRGASAPKEAYDYYVDPSGQSYRLDKGSAAPANTMGVSAKLYAKYQKDSQRRVQTIEEGRGMSVAPSLSVSSSRGSVQTVSQPQMSMATPTGVKQPTYASVVSKREPIVTVLNGKAKQPGFFGRVSQFNVAGKARVADIIPAAASRVWSWIPGSKEGKQRVEKTLSVVTDRSEDKIVVGSKDYSGIIGGVQDVGQFFAPQSAKDVAIYALPGAGGFFGKGAGFIAEKGGAKLAGKGFGKIFGKAVVKVETKAVPTILKTTEKTAVKTLAEKQGLTLLEQNLAKGSVKVVTKGGEKVVKTIIPKAVGKAPVKDSWKLTQGIQKIENVFGSGVAKVADKTGVSAVISKSYIVAEKTGAKKVGSKVVSALNFPERKIGDVVGKVGKTRLGKAVEKNVFFRGGKKVYYKLGETGTGNVVRELPVIVGKTELVRTGTEKYRRITTSEDVKQISKEFNVGQAYSSGLQGQKKKLGLEVPKGAGFLEKTKVFGGNVLGSVAYELPISNLYFGTGGFEAGVKEDLIKQGFEPGTKRYDSAFKAVMRERTTKNIIEGATTVYSSKEAERFGRKQVASAFQNLFKKGVVVPEKQLGSKIFKTVFAPIGRAGAIEGSVSEFEQQKIRLTGFDLKSIGIMGGLGFITAGGIGGSIGALKPAKPGASKGVEWLANIADPVEKPADIFENILEWAARKRGKTVVSPPLIKITGSKQPMAMFGVGSAKTPAKTQRGVSPKGSAEFGGIAPVSPFGKSVSGGKVPVSAFAPSMIPSFAKVPTRTDTKIPIDPTPYVPVPVVDPKVVPAVNPFVFSQSLTQEAPVQTSTFADTFTFATNIPTVTPQLRVPTPLPLAFPATSGKTVGKRGGKKTFANELSLAMGLLQKNVNTPVAKKVVSSSKKKKRSVVRRKVSNPFFPFL